MTQEDIIKLAREAASEDGTTRPDKNIVLYAAKTSKFLERFAQLVRAYEREACAELCLEEANEAYRQEAFYLPRGNQGLLRIAEGAKRCAEAIRARGEQ
jgi:hypothetical protein